VKRRKIAGVNSRGRSGRDGGVNGKEEFEAEELKFPSFYVRTACCDS
jgi:hypothetical protein